MEKLFVTVNRQGYTVSSASKIGYAPTKDARSALDVANLFSTPGVVTMRTTVGEVAVSVPEGGALVTVQPVQEG